MSDFIKSIQTMKARNGSTTAKVETTNGLSFFLHSTYKPEEEAKNWLKYIELTSNTVYLVFGFGLGYHIKELLQNLPNNCRICVIEYSKEENLAQFAYQVSNDRAWMLDKRLTLFAGPNIRDMAGEIAQEMLIAKLKRVRVCRHYPSMAIFTDFYKQAEEKLVQKIQELFTITLDFQTDAALLYLSNMWKNMPHVWSNPGICGFKDAFKGKPAIIVSSGPSLGKNIHLLKYYTDKAIIIASGSAGGALRQGGIVPHFLVMLDPNPIMYDTSKDDYSEQAVLLSSYDTEPRVIANYPGKKFFYRNNTGLVLRNLTKLLPQSDELKRNVSVAVTAFDFAVYAGADPIIFVGQDLSYTDEKNTHAEGANYVLPQSDPVVYIKGQNGKLLKTKAWLKEVAEFLGSYIATLKGRTIINATEGGAYLDGAMHLPLAEVADKYFKTVIDPIKVVNKINLDFKTGNQQYIREEVVKTLRELQEFEVSNERFINKMKQMININVGDKLVYTDSVSQIKDYFADLQRKSIYVYVKDVIDPLFLLFRYEQNEGLEIENELEGYFKLLEHLQTTIEFLCPLVSESLTIFDQLTVKPNGEAR